MKYGWMRQGLFDWFIASAALMLIAIAIGGCGTKPRTEAVSWQPAQKVFPQPQPQPGGENARINLWLVDGNAPKDSKEAEIIIKKFEFVPH